MFDRIYRFKNTEINSFFDLAIYQLLSTLVSTTLWLTLWKWPRLAAGVTRDARTAEVIEP